MVLPETTEAHPAGFCIIALFGAALCNRFGTESTGNIVVEYQPVLLTVRKNQ
jgi:hypothetical protein